MHETTDLTAAEGLFLAAHRRQNRSEKTIEHYRSTFKDWHRYLGETDRPSTVAVLTTESIRAFADWLAATPTRVWRGSTTRSVSGIHGRLRDMRAFTRFLESEGVIERAPKVELPDLPEEEFRILSEQQIGELFACRYLSANGPQAIRNRALIALMLDTGVRLAEVAGIRLDDLYLDDHLVLVRGKGKKERRVAYADGVAELLADWLKERGDAPGELFWLSSYGIYCLFQRIQKETGLPVHPHMLRHQAATELVRRHANPAVVKRILGHADLSTTLRYVNLSYEDLREQHAAASPFEKYRQHVQPVEKPGRKRLSLTK